MDINTPPPPPPPLLKPVRSLEFYYADRNIVFQVHPLTCSLLRYPNPTVYHPQVSNILYQLHKSVLAARLNLFSGMFILSNGQCQPVDGQDDDHAIQIEDGVAVREDFESLVRHIYGRCVFLPCSHCEHRLSSCTRWTTPLYPVPFLLSVLKLSTRWGLEDGCKLAIYYLVDSKTKFLNLLKFYASIKYDIPEWTHPAFDMLVSADWRLRDLPLLYSYDLSLDIIDLIIKI